MATPKALILNKNMNLLKNTDQFLETKDWVEKVTSCKALYHLYNEELKAATLMDHVLNITAERKKKILEIIAANPELILIRTRGDVKYRSSKQNKTIVRIRIANVSPLEAAALSGDFHLVNIFRDALLRDGVPKNLKHQAGLQLSAILSRADFLAAFKALQTTYQIFLKEFDELYNAEKWDAIDNLWEQVGEAQKKLSTFGLQVFCNPVPHDPLPNFKQEPIRSCRFEVYKNNRWCEVDSDLDSFGLGTTFALLKAGCARGLGLGVGPRVGWRAGSDCEAINLLCKVIPDQLSNTKTLLLQYAPEAREPQATLQSSLSNPLVPDKEKEPARAALS